MTRLTDAQLRAAFKGAYPALEAELALGENNPNFHGLEDLRARHAFEYFKRGARSIEAELSKQEPVAYVPRCINDCEHGVKGEIRFSELDEKPFDVASPDTWECAPLYTAPLPAAPDTVQARGHMHVFMSDGQIGVCKICGERRAAPNSTP